MLDTDEIWTLYGTEGAGGALLVYGLIQGQGSSSGGAFTVNSLKDYYYDGTSASGTLSARYQVGSSDNLSAFQGSFPWLVVPTTTTTRLLT